MLVDSQPKLTAKLTAVDFDPFAGGELHLCAPATEAQKEIWISVQMGDDANCAYNESMSLGLRGPLDVDALRYALQELVHRHEALRTTFSPDGVTLCIASSLRIDVPLVDLSNQGDREAKLAQLRRQAVKQPFDLKHGPLFRAQIIRCSPQEHLAILTAHHIICDGWSWGVLLPDLGALYSAFRQGVAADLPEPERFSEYALLEEQQIQSPEYIATEEYWFRQFSDRIPVLDLPTDRPRLPLRSHKAAREDWKVNPSLVTQLKRIGAKAGCSFNTTLLAGFEVFLLRISGQEDIVVGLPAAGQAFTGRESLVGHCVNLLPLRSRIDGKQSFSDYLCTRRTAMLDAYEHQQLTFGSLLKQLTIPRDPSRIPLVPVTFNVDRAIRGEDLPFDGLEVEVFSNPRYFENFEIAVNASVAGGDLVLECQYNTDLFDAQTIRRRMEEFEVLLAGIVADPNQQISKLPILPSSEQKLLMEWNNTQTNYPSDKSIHQLFEAQVAQTPEAVAVVYEDQQLTYRELNAKANQLAHYLRSHRVGPEVLVGICVERSLLMVVGLLGILKAGGAYVPLDPTYPKERLAFILEDSQVPVLVTMAHLVESLPENQARVVCLDADWETIDRESSDNVASQVTPDNLAYLIYTSGSTGRPKGVAIEHHSTVALLDWAREIFAPEYLAGVLASTSICFDLSVFELFVPLCWGGKVILAQNALALPTLPAAHQVTLINTVPSAITELLRVDGVPASVRVVNLAGEPLQNSLVQQLYQKETIQHVFNLYGPSEDTTYSTFAHMKKGDSIVTIGRPIANTRCLLLDAQMQPVPIGVLGEVYISGAGLARGYLNRPELTALRFIANPQGDQPSDRLYKTGDLARYLPDGNIEFLGRIDHQVKIRGFRIELGEIEAVLNQHPAVRETVAIAREDVPGNKRLVAYVVPKQPAPTISDLRRFLKEKLPEYMVPSAFLLLDALPLTPNGKVDRRALPAPEMSRSDSKETFVAPRNPLELQLTNIWEKILGIKPIGVTDNFFELGGHSLLAPRLLAEIEKAFNKNLPLATIFQAPTIEQLASILHQSGALIPYTSVACPSMAVIQQGSSQPPLFCIHVLGRGLEFYRPLVNYLDRSQPVYGLSTQLMDKKQAPPTRVEDLAAYYIKEMRTIQPEGPYFLTGVSFGGTIAFEIARQLHMQGQKVALLALLDTYGQVAIKCLSRRGRIFDWIKLLQLGQTDVFCAKVKANLKGKIENFNHRRLNIFCQFYLMMGLPLPNRLQDHLYTKENAQALEGYVPQIYPGRITLFKAVDVPIPDVDPKLGWGELAAGGLEIHDIPSNHLGMLREPYVQVLGEKLRACIERAQADNLY